MNRLLFLMAILFLVIPVLCGCKGNKVIEYAVDAEVVSVYNQRVKRSFPAFILGDYDYSSVITARYNDKDYVINNRHSSKLQVGDIIRIYVPIEDLIEGEE